MIIDWYPGTGFGGVTDVYSDNVQKMADFTRYNYPIVRLSGTNNDGTWSLHAGAGNYNGQDGCNAICKTLGHTGIKPNWNVKGGSGYPAKYTKVASNCIYKAGPVDSKNDDWSGTYGTTESCGNPMYHCDCEGKPAIRFQS